MKTAASILSLGSCGWFLCVLWLGCRAVSAEARSRTPGTLRPGAWALPPPDANPAPPEGLLSVRGGGVVPRKNPTTTAPSPAKAPSPKRTAVVLGTALAGCALWVSRSSWMALFDKEVLLEKTLATLRELNAFPKHYSYTVYALGMAFWETLGLSTIPVETAAGMVFGWHGFYLSALGKLAGAVLAFALVRYGLLADFIQRRLSGNTVLGLIDQSAESNPFLVSLLMKCSCFPETIKNYGSALIKPIKLWMFVLGTMTHGWTFTALWTYFGVDTAMRLEDPSLPVDKTLQLLLSAALVNGVVVSPLAMAYWVKSLRETSAAAAASWKHTRKAARKKPPPGKARR